MSGCLLSGDGRLVRVIAAEVVQDGGEARILVEDPENFLTMLQGDLLSVSAVGHRFSLIVLELDMTEQRVGQVLHNEPLDLRSHKKTNIISQREKRGHRGKVRADLEMSLPLILSPNIAGVIVVDMRHHLGHALKVPASIVAEEKENGSVLGIVLESAIKPAISLWKKNDEENYELRTGGRKV